MFPCLANMHCCITMSARDSHSAMTCDQYIPASCSKGRRPTHTHTHRADRPRFGIWASQRSKHLICSEKSPAFVRRKPERLACQLLCLVTIQRAKPSAGAAASDGCRGDLLPRVKSFNARCSLSHWGHGRHPRLLRTTQQRQDLRTWGIKKPMLWRGSGCFAAEFIEICTLAVDKRKVDFCLLCYPKDNCSLKSA